MNDRIKELRKQAAMEVCNANQWTNDDEWNDLFMAKFAELIVRECALTLYKSAVQDKQAGFDHESKIMELAGDMIKQQFGVE